jgi:hypothetical protein
MLVGCMEGHSSGRCLLSVLEMLDHAIGNLAFRLTMFDSGLVPRVGQLEALAA